MKNPFKPSQIVSQPDEFYGRNNEITTLGRLIGQGSIAIQGSFGVGKSSLMSRTLLHMDGFGAEKICSYKIVVGHSDIKNIELAAKLVLEELVDVDSRSHSLTVGIPKVASFSSKEAYTLFQEGRNLAALNKIIENTAFKEAISNQGYFVIAIDEVEKCAPAIAKLIRQINTKAELNGIDNIRFIFAGVSPFVEKMVAEDQGVMRFIYEVLDLQPFSQEDAQDFLDRKFHFVIKSAEQAGMPVKVDPIVIDRIMQLSGGHPHLLQLLGSHVVEHEYSYPDGVIDSENLMGSLNKICYQKRAAVYDKLIHDMKVEAKYDPYFTIISQMGGEFPGKIDISSIIKFVEKEDINWFLNQNILVVHGDQYEIVDELLRVRVFMDVSEDAENIEKELISYGRIRDNDDDDESSCFFD